MLTGSVILPGSLSALLTFLICFPIFCNPSPLGISTNPPDKKLPELTSPVSNVNDAILPDGNTNNGLVETDVDGGNPWQELFWEEEQVRSKKEAVGSGGPGDSLEVMIVEGEDENKPILTTTTFKPTRKTDNSVVNAEYVCTDETPEGVCKSPLLKHYKIYAIDPEDKFYPGWTYHGFNC